MRGERSQRGEPSTTKSVRTAAWDTKPRKSLLLLRPQPSTALSERQGTQTPSLAPRAPPSRLIPEREQQKVVVFLRERKQGAGQLGAVLALYAAIPFCLYSSNTPTQTFCELVEQHKHKPRHIFLACNPVTLKRCFHSDASLKRDVENTMFFDLNGRIVKPRIEDLPDREFAEGLMNFHKTMYDCRTKLIDKYIREFDCNASLYFERLNELPIPPLLFFSEISPGGQAKGVQEQEFSRRNQPLYKIAAHPGEEPQNDIVFAGLTAIDG